MHKTYKTKGFVLGGTNIKEGDRYLMLFTRELGLLRAVARSARLEKSKLRYSLQQLDYSTFSLVHGKELWRVTGAEIDLSLFYTCKNEPAKLLVLSRIFSLLVRLLQGEEKNEALFDLLYEGVLFLNKEQLDKEVLENFEYILVLRILALLGYVGDNGKLTELLETSPFDAKTLEKASPLRSIALREINTALKESHL